MAEGERFLSKFIPKQSYPVSHSLLALLPLLQKSTFLFPSLDPHLPELGFSNYTPLGCLLKSLCVSGFPSRALLSPALLCDLALNMGTVKSGISAVLSSSTSGALPKLLWGKGLKPSFVLQWGDTFGSCFSSTR
uniref:Uncharacterized protein n=1 Tax=Zosterops lateralis melanops TaxID=1220523 RepID=A0A8D2QS89_ZOSLA